jgi:hypothetical protein
MYTDNVCLLTPRLIIYHQHLHTIQVLSKAYVTLHVWTTRESYTDCTCRLAAINRLVFYATWGNIMANIATLISTAGIPKDPNILTPLCEFQGVLIQWFMMADSLWVFCMATNVYLVFWRGYDAQQLRYLEKCYLLLAYGMPVIAPMVYVIMDHHSKTRIMGPATVR